MSEQDKIYAVKCGRLQACINIAIDLLDDGMSEKAIEYLKRIYTEEFGDEQE